MNANNKDATIGKIAFNLDEFRSRQNSEKSLTESMSQLSLDAPTFRFRDNLDLEDFVRLNSIAQYKYRI